MSGTAVVVASTLAKLNNRTELVTGPLTGVSRDRAKIRHEEDATRTTLLQAVDLEEPCKKHAGYRAH